MNRTRITRAAGSIAGLVLVAALGVTPALAASNGAAHAGTRTAAEPGLAAETDRTRCAEAWRAAATNPGVETYQALGLCEIDRRLATIERLSKAIDTSRALTDAHHDALATILDDSAAGLRALRAKIEADTTVVELRADLHSIYADFRIYALVTRQVWLVNAADVVDLAGARLSDTADDLASLIAQAEAAGKDVTGAQAHLDAMTAAITSALDHVDGVAEDVLALTPADWNDGSAQPVLRAAREAIVAARGGLRTALAEARQVIAALA